jgi:hypothetical protein
MAKLLHKKIVSANRLLTSISICLGILFLTVAPTDARRSAKGPVKLAIYLAKAGELEKKYLLMVKAEDQVDGDAVPLYEKAIKSIPKDFNQDQISAWLKLPIGQFPQQQAEGTLQKYLEPLKLMARAARCKECNWPQVKPGDQLGDLSSFRKLAYILELWARLEISQGGYEGAIIAMRTDFRMARHLGQAPTIIQGLVGISVGTIMCKELEQYLQGQESPNLYQALADMPKPLVDVEKAIENEKKISIDLPPNDVRQGQTTEQREAGFDRVRLISKRLDNNLNGLQCVEAIRYYAATHAGQLPQALDDIKELEIPKDLVSGKPFEYHRTAMGATLRSAIPEGGSERDTFHYEIVLKK